MGRTLLAWVFFGFWCPLVRAEWTIVVDPGPFGSPQTAVQSQDQVNWLDGNLADDNACTHCFAAMELQRYLRRMTGLEADFAIAVAPPATGDVFLVGTSDHGEKQLGPEGYRIESGRRGGRQLVSIAGGGRVGTLYGVYDLLYRLGCRWFSPGEIGEEVPRIDVIPDINVVEQPSFITRGFLAWEDRGDPDFLLWMARNRMNYWCVEQKGHGLMRKLGIRVVAGLHDAEERFLNPAGEYPYAHPRFPAGAGKPRDPYALSAEYQGDADHDGKLCYFEAHPEWYAFDGNRRIPGIKGMLGTNYCTSNRDATAEFMKNYVAALVDGPYRDADIVRFWTLDGGRWCQCPACKAAGSQTDRNLALVHRLDQEIQQARTAGRIHRPISMTFLAYADVLEPPLRPLPADFSYPRCAATFYPINRCYVHPLDDVTCEANARYQAQLQGWAVAPARHFQGQICIGEYYNVSVFKSLPIVFMHTMARDIPSYYAVGARHFDYMHVTTKNWGSKALTNYQMARQIWDVRCDCPKLWDDYFAKRYGAAATRMRSFYESLEQMLANVTEVKYGLARRLERGVADLFPNAQLRYRREPGVLCQGPALVEMIEHGRRCRAEIAGAQTMDLPGRVRARIAEDEAEFTYAERTLAYYDACVQAFQSARTNHMEEAQKHFAEAQRLAGLLRALREQTRYSSSHANAEDALAATLAPRAVEQIARLIK